MVQKSILSFFAAAKAKKPENESENSSQSEDKDAKSAKSKSSHDDDSPVKKSSRGRARVIESDSEDEAQPSTSSSPSKSDEEKENKQKNSPEVKSKKGTPGKGKKGKAVEESPKVKKNKAEEKMEVDDQKEEIVANGEAKKDEVEEATAVTSSPSGSSSAGTPKKGSGKTVGFSPETVPPLRKTARKQMKRKSDSMESKQLEVVKKLKKEEKKDEESEETVASSQGTPDKKESEKDTGKKQETKKETKEEDSETEVKKEETKDEEEPMEVDGPQEDKKEAKEEKDKSSTPSTKKPIHSFFAPRSPKKCVSKVASTSPKKSDGDKEEEEEEHGSSPIKKQKPTPTRRRNVIDSDSEDEATEDQDKDTEDQKEKISEDQVKESSKSPCGGDSNSKKTKGRTPKTEKKNVKSSPEASGKSPKISSKSPKTDTKSDESEKADTKVDKSEKTDAKPEKKPVVNPFAPKSAGSGDPGEKYNPGKEKYDPVKDAFWEHGSKVPYLALAKTFELIEKTSGRLKTIEILANFLRSVIVLSPDDLLQCVYLCLNKVAPAFEGVELGVGDMILMRAIAQSSGRSVDKIKSDAEERGDLGIVAEHSRSNQKLMFQPAKLNVRGVFDKLKEIALMTGNAIQSKKMEKIKGMFVACRFSEARFLIRSLGGKLRIGLAEQSVLHAIAQACYLTPPGQDFPPEVLNAGKGLGPDKLKAEIDNYGLILKTTYCEFPNYDKIIDVLMKEGLEKLPEHCKLTPGIPLKPMLAHPTSGVTEVLKRFENAKFTCEFKYDGERAQIHLKEDGSIRIYSRNQEDNTTKYPDIINRFKNAVGESVKSCVIDSEAVAWDQEKKQILPFQILSTRKRKDANEKEIKVQVCVFPFDLLYLNGMPLVCEPFEKRRSLLKENFNEVEGEFIFAKSMDSTNTEDIEEFLEESIKGNCEGLMVKTLDVDATYEIAKRSRNWLKLKKDYLDGVGDTIDAVVIGSYWGKGKRKGNYGCFLLACYDPDNEEFQSLCKIGTGFTDEQLQTHTAFLKDHVIEKPKSYYRYDSSHEPDCWFEAVQVWEVKCADLSVSPHHKAASGVVDPEKGISLRFPRFIRIRDDKTPENATSSTQIADLYNSQAQIQNKNSNKAVEEDFY